MLQSKLPHTGTTIFTTMSRLATEHRAINLGQGFPDFPMNEKLVSLVNKAMQDGYNQYVPMQGYLPLRESIAEKIETLYQTAVSPETEITITPGGTYAIYTALTTILQPDDEVIVFEPAYDSYIPNILVNGAVPVRIPLHFPDYKINWQQVKERITGKTKAIILNNPNNPAASILSKEDIAQLKKITAGTGIFLISDEVYEHIVFDGQEHQSILRYPELLQRSFVCFSFGKVYHCTGWKLGYCIAPAGIMAEFRKIHQYNCFSCHSPSQVALATFLKEKEHYLSLSSFLQQKRDLFLSLLSGSRFEFLHSSGSYFICARYSRISDEKDIDFTVRLTKEAGVATIPVSSFYQDGEDNKVIRFCFAKKDETLEKAAEQLLRTA